jgi:hypothetical protein
LVRAAPSRVLRLKRSTSAGGVGVGIGIGIGIGIRIRTPCRPADWGPSRGTGDVLFGVDRQP